MKIIGITAEYNPFHWGHHIQLELARQFADGIVVVQSGPFCQRGDLSVLDPWAKANVAIQAGADLVLAYQPASSARLKPLLRLPWKPWRGQAS